MREEAFIYCEEVIKAHSASFYKAFSKLPRQKAKAIYAIYAFCRMCDDFIDEAQDLDALKALEKDLRRFEQGDTPDGDVWWALREVFSTYEMSLTPFYDQVKGQYMDADFKTIETQSQLEEYCYFVASSVGMMILPILATKKHHELVDIAIKLGVAMQITNILRDVGEDLDRNRIYLPQELLNRYSYTKGELLDRKLNQAFVQLWEDEARRAEIYYAEVENTIKAFDLDSRLAVTASLQFYRGILNQVRKNKYDCFTKRAYVSRQTKLQLLVKSVQVAYF